MPKASLPAWASSRAPGMLSRIHLTLLAEKYGSGMSPVMSVMRCATAGSPAISSMMGAVRRHCHTMALYTGLPVSRSQTTVVSRWLVMPMLSMSAGPNPFCTRSSVSAPSVDDRMSRGSCSTQPGCGNIWGKGFCTLPAMRPSRSMSTARDEVVPWSRAIT